MTRLPALRLELLWMASCYVSLCCSQLAPSFYNKTCPGLETMVLDVMTRAVQKEPRIAASILRLFFHDCFVQGCDGSVLLDDTTNFQGEKKANPNNNSLRGFEIIDNIKTEVEAQCKGVVSCADILALAARDGVFLLNGPNWMVPLGRRDSRTASFAGANNNLPSPSSTVSQLISKFQAQGLSIRDMVVLSGGHTIGQARCLLFRQRLYNQAGTGQPDPTLDKAYAVQLQRTCPASGGDNNLCPLDTVTPNGFDNQYFIDLENQKGLLTSDEVLFTTSGSSTVAMVRNYAKDLNAFSNDFKASMVNMGNLKPLTGTNGEIRSSCRLRN